MKPTLQDARSLAETLRPVIEAHRAEADAQRRLPRELAEILRASGAFRFSTPLERNGYELPLATLVDVYEAFGHIDGPVAWNIWNGNLGFSAALLAEEAGDQIWSSDADPIIANSARVTGAGVPVDGGYALSGRWDIVSAIDIADWVALFGVVMQGENPRMVNGAPDVRVFFLRTGDVQIIDTWHTTGMRGTGSKSVVVEHVVVPEAMAISPFAPSRIDRPLYRIPAFTLASTGAAPIVVGVAQAALDELIALAATKATDNGQKLAQRPHVHSQVAAAQTSLHAARLLLRDAAATIDAAATANEPVSELLRARLRAAMSHAASVSRDVLMTCQVLASSSAIYLANPIERLVRDGLVAAQHAILSSTHIDILGRLTFGLDAGAPVV
jgi:alkylation response protein AidB-like acyl-CoA dehydrogenase